MSDRKAEFRDCTGAPALELELWPAVVIPKRDIEAEIERLAQLPAPPNGRRMSLIVHPHATEPGLGLAPGIRVTLSVLRPGEQTKPIRHNSTQIDFCIRGAAPRSCVASASTLPKTMYGTLPRGRHTGTSMTARASRC